MLSLLAGKQKSTRKSKNLRQLEHEIIVLVLNGANLKLRAQLHDSLEKFMLYVNEEQFYELPRIVCFATPSFPEDKKDKISTKFFCINNYSVIDQNSSKSLTAIDALI